MSIRSEIDEDYENFEKAKNCLNNLKEMKEKGYLTKDGYRAMAGNLFSKMRSNAFASRNYSWRDEESNFYGD